MEKLKKCIILFIVVIIIVIAIILSMLAKKQSNIDKEEELKDDVTELIEEKDDNGCIDVTDANVFYSVINSVNRYLEIIQYDVNIGNEIQNSDVYIQYDIDKEYLFNIKTDEQKLEAVYQLLDKNYIESNKITLENIQDYLYEINQNTVLTPIQMKAKYGTNINTYILKAYLNNDELQEKYFIIRTDNRNQSFSIEFVKDNYEDIKQVKFVEGDEHIEKKQYNIFKIESIREEKVAQKYLLHYRDLAIKYPDIVYNNYLDEEYKKKRFGSLENYKKYIEDNKKELQYIQITNYLVENNDNKKIYVCLDQYKNTYVFTEEAMMQYKVILDTYTIQSDKFKATYNTADEQKKVMMNVDKFIMMLNNRDYSNAYNLLDTTFRENTFGDENKFEEYIREKYPLHYRVEYYNFEKKGENIYVQQINLFDITEMDENILEFVIVMRLDQGTNFSMSFEV